MQYTIQLNESEEEALLRIAKSSGRRADEVLAGLVDLLLGQPIGTVFIRYYDGAFAIQVGDKEFRSTRSTPGVMGGDTCIRDTRIAIWQLVQLKRSGFSEERILANFPGLTAADLISAWDFYAGNSAQIEAELRAHEDAA
jgi:uncharacterized protein (DUF433 family)